MVREGHRIHGRQIPWNGRLLRNIFMATGMEKYLMYIRWAYDYSKTDDNGEYIIPGSGFCSPGRFQ